MRKLIEHPWFQILTEPSKLPREGDKLPEGLMCKIGAVRLEVAANPVVMRELCFGQDCFMKAAAPLLKVPVGIPLAVEVNAIAAV